MSNKSSTYICFSYAHYKEKDHIKESKRAKLHADTNADADAHTDVSTATQTATTAQYTFPNIPNIPDEMNTMLQGQIQNIQLSDKRGMRWDKRYDSAILFWPKNVLV